MIVERRIPLRWLQGTLVAGLIGTIFVVDLFTDWAVAVAVLYIVPLLLSLRLMPRQRLIWLVAGCAGLTAVGSLGARFGSAQVGMLNTAISLIAIFTTAYLGSRLLAHEAASHEARAQLLRLSRIGNLGELTSSIAHEVNQPLAAVSSSAAACRRWLAADPPELAKAGESLDRVTREALRAAEVIAGVRRLATRTAALREWCSMAELIRQCIQVAQPTLDDQQIDVVVEVDDHLPMLRIDRVQVQQVLSNLLLNAIESLATKLRGTRHIRIAAREEQGFVSIEVADSGAGLSQEAQRHLFEPFWTSKEGGTGLGLTISRSIAEAHEGALRSRQLRGGGAAFELRLPLVTEE